MKAHLGSAGSKQHTVAAAELVEEYQVRAERASESEQDPTKSDEQKARYRLRLIAMDAARSTLKVHTDHVESETHGALAQELDMEEQQLPQCPGRSGRYDLRQSAAPCPPGAGQGDDVSLLGRVVLGVLGLGHL